MKSMTILITLLFSFNTWAADINCSAFMLNSEANTEVNITLKPASYDKKFLTGEIGHYKFGALTHDIAKNEIYLTFADTRTENTSVTFGAFVTSPGGNKEARFTHYDYNDPSGSRVVYRVSCRI